MKALVSVVMNGPGARGRGGLEVVGAPRLAARVHGEQRGAMPRDLEVIGQDLDATDYALDDRSRWAAPRTSANSPPLSWITRSTGLRSVQNR
jgi:hypothetical protein